MIYLKIFIIIILIVIIISLLKQENFQTTSSIGTDSDSNSSIDIKTVNFNIRRKGAKSIEINWEKTNYDITKYIIKLYINNDGPFIEIKDIKTDDININFILNDIKVNTVYEIGIAAITDNVNSPSKYNVKEFMINSYDDDLTVNYKTDFNENNIVCNPNGQHISVNKCDIINEEQYIQATGMDTQSLFNENEYSNLMRDLNKTKSLKLSFEDATPNNNNDYKYALKYSKLIN